MESEGNIYQDFYKHLEDREWSDVQVVNLMQQIAMAGLSHQIRDIHNLFKYQQQADEQIEAEKEMNRWAIAREFVPRGTMIAQSFFEDAEEYRLRDHEGEALEPGETNWEQLRQSINRKLREECEQDRRWDVC